ncbi:MAG: AMP-binding protein, partial [Ilumatobacter fluminis]
MTLLTALDQEHADPAITVDGATVHLSELRTRADRLGGELIGADAVAIPGAPTLDTVIAVVAAIRAGVAAVPVPIDAGPVERGHILRDSGATLLIGEPDWPEVDLPRVRPTADRGAQAGSSLPGAITDDATALIMYTSGTTGLPKGVLIPRRAVA